MYVASCWVGGGASKTNRSIDCEDGGTELVTLLLAAALLLLLGSPLQSNFRVILIQSGLPKTKRRLKLEDPALLPTTVQYRSTNSRTIVNGTSQIRNARFEAGIPAYLATHYSTINATIV